MKKLWLEMDVAGTLGDDAWIDMEQPKGFMEGGVLTDKKAPCDHPVEQPHSEGEWREVWARIEDIHVEDAVLFYKEKERVLAVEIED